MDAFEAACEKLQSLNMDEVALDSLLRLFTCKKSLFLTCVTNLVVVADAVFAEDWKHFSPLLSMVFGHNTVLSTDVHRLFEKDCKENTQQVIFVKAVKVRSCLLRCMT